MVTLTNVELVQIKFALRDKINLEKELLQDPNLSKLEYNLAQLNIEMLSGISKKLTEATANLDKRIAIQY